jgi:hypothetical protein
MTTQVQLINSGGQATFEGFVSPGPLYVRSLSFSFATAGLTTGVPFVQVRAGDVIYDIGIAVTVAFNGTTPLADVGTFSGNTGLFDQLAGATVDLTSANVAIVDNTGLSSATSANWLQAAVGSAGAALGGSYQPAQVTVTADSFLSLVVSQTGAKGGSATGASAGSGFVYVVTSTPG